MDKGLIITLSGISGAGKSHFIKSVLRKFSNFEKLKSVTTRKLRDDETDGVDKHFINLETFDQLNSNNEMDIVNKVFDNMYGYYFKDLQKPEMGISLITELYFKEVGSFKNKYPQTLSVYLIPYDISKAIVEIENRNTSAEDIKRRIEDIKKELDYVNNNSDVFDLIITNDYTLTSVDNFLKQIESRLEALNLNSFDNVEVLDNKYTPILDKFMDMKSRDVVYTSFDGDDMNYLHNICRSIIDDGKIPLNPEAALGYYVSTVTLGGNKINVMTDCLSLELLSNELYIFGKEGRELSEGIIAEMILWKVLRSNGVTTVYDVCDLKNKTLKYYNQTELEQLIGKYDVISKHELHNNLLNEYMEKTHKTAYVIANFSNYKHLDWARAFCYNNGYCPISPQNIFPYSLYEDNIEDYMLARLELLKRSDKILLFIDRYSANEEIDGLDEFSKTELSYSRKNGKQVEIIGGDEALVPKYNPNKKWSLTSKEDLQIRKLIK